MAGRFNYSFVMKPFVGRPWTFVTRMEIEVSASIKRRVVGAGVLATTAAAACVLFLASTRVEPAATASASPAASGFSPVFPLAVEPLWFAEPDGFQLFGFGFLLDVQFFYNQPNPPPPVRTLIDSGSATLSACDASVADGRGALIVKTTRGEPVGSCNAYGNGAPEGFWVRARPDAGQVTPSCVPVLALPRARHGRPRPRPPRARARATAVRAPSWRMTHAAVRRRGTRTMAACGSARRSRWPSPR